MTPVRTKFLATYGFTVKSVNSLAENDPKGLMDLQLEYLTGDLETSQWISAEWAAEMYHSPYLMTIEEFKSSTNDVGELAKVFHAFYERSADDISRINQRAAYAQEWYNFFIDLNNN